MELSRGKHLGHTGFVQFSHEAAQHSGRWPEMVGKSAINVVNDCTQGQGHGHANTTLSGGAVARYREQQRYGDKIISIRVPP